MSGRELEPAPLTPRLAHAGGGREGGGAANLNYLLMLWTDTWILFLFNFYMKVNYLLISKIKLFLQKYLISPNFSILPAQELWNKLVYAVIDKVILLLRREFTENLTHILMSILLLILKFPRHNLRPSQFISFGWKMGKSLTTFKIKVFNCSKSVMYNSRKIRQHYFSVDQNNPCVLLL